MILITGNGVNCEMFDRKKYEYAIKNKCPHLKRKTFLVMNEYNNNIDWTKSIKSFLVQKSLISNDYSLETIIDSTQFIFFDWLLFKREETLGFVEKIFDSDDNWESKINKLNDAIKNTKIDNEVYVINDPTNIFEELSFSKIKNILWVKPKISFSNALTYSRNIDIHDKFYYKYFKIDDISNMVKGKELRINSDDNENLNTNFMDNIITKIVEEIIIEFTRFTTFGCWKHYCCKYSDVKKGIKKISCSSNFPRSINGFQENNHIRKCYLNSFCSKIENNFLNFKSKFINAKSYTVNYFDFFLNYGDARNAGQNYGTIKPTRNMNMLHGAIRRESFKDTYFRLVDNYKNIRNFHNFRDFSITNVSKADRKQNYEAFKEHINLLNKDNVIKIYIAGLDVANENKLLEIIPDNCKTNTEVYYSVYGKDDESRKHEAWKFNNYFKNEDKFKKNKKVKIFFFNSEHLWDETSLSEIEKTGLVKPEKSPNKT